MSRLSEFRKVLASYFTRSVVGLLVKTPLTPNTISWIGFLVTVGAGALIVTGHLFAAGFVVLAAGFFDILDGALARRTNRVTRFGAVLDSTLDRLAEAVILIGLLIVYTREAAVAEVALVSATLIGSQLVSYVRARAEGIGIQCEVGIFTRAERVILLSLGLLLSQFDYALITALAIIMVFSYVTAGQRLFHVWQQTKN